jgi:hypothetical protein
VVLERWTMETRRGKEDLEEEEVKMEVSQLQVSSSIASDADS